MKKHSLQNLNSAARATGLFLCLLVLANLAQAKELRVGYTAAGSYATIQSAVDSAGPGDTITLNPEKSPYFESVIFNNKKGAAGKPVVIDGQGAVLDGSEPLKADEWSSAGDGLYKSTALPARLKMVPAILMRYFFVFEGKVNRMGHASKSADIPYIQPAELQPGQWTYVEAEKCFYLKLQPGQPLDAVRAPVLAAGISLMGDCEYITVQNITSTRCWNDGFNIHGRSREILFSHIKAIDCGDDGISAHDDCWITVEGLVSVGNATGFCHIGQSRSKSKDVFIRDCASYGIFLLDASHHEVENCAVYGDSGYALRLFSGAYLKASNILLAAEKPLPFGVAVERGSTLKLSAAGGWQMPFAVNKSTVAVQDSAFNCGKAALVVDKDSQWSAANNLWDVSAIQWQGTTFRTDAFKDYQAASAQDKGSRLGPVRLEDLLKGAYRPQGFEPAKIPRFPGGASPAA